MDDKEKEIERMRKSLEFLEKDKREENQVMACAGGCILVPVVIAIICCVSPSLGSAILGAINWLLEHLF